MRLDRRHWRRHSVIPYLAVSLLWTSVPGSSLAQSTGPEATACPSGAIAVEVGQSIQAAVDRAGPGKPFCLKNGLHRLQSVQPLSGQSFYGEGRTVLSGATRLTEFASSGGRWAARWTGVPAPRHGDCRKGSEACNHVVWVFIDGQPLQKAASKAALTRGRFFLEESSNTLVLADDPRGKVVEATHTPLAFFGSATNVTIKNLTIEKYANPAQKGAIHGQDGSGWSVQRVEVRLNNGVGVRVASNGRLQQSSVHHNGQLGATALGHDIVIEDNEIWANNFHNFDFAWEAGGVKVVVSDTVVFRRNRVHGNIGPGLWCDIECRNVLYEDNVVSNNHGVGIFHEISYDAVVRRNKVSGNGFGFREWFWGADILIAASEGVRVYGNTISVSSGGCAIMLIDQNRRSDKGVVYKTRNNLVYNNEMKFAAGPCAGGVSDAKVADDNFEIIATGKNTFDDNSYVIMPGAGIHRFVWGSEALDWNGFRATGNEPNGRLLSK